MNKKFNPYERIKEESSAEEILGKFLKGYRLDKGIDAVEVKNIWYSEMGNGVKNYTQEVIFRKNTLFVTLTSAVLREELNYGKELIIQKLNEALGKELIQSIVFR
ncbi:MAG TPA: DUF721 domain-containing protein [Flavobacterium sp.]|nr:DUF721 domain-containing protein [Flavobacterium sp.]